MNGNITFNEADTNLPVVTNRAEAEQLCGRLLTTIDTISAILEVETLAIRNMDLAKVSGLHGQKNEAAKTYLQDLKIVKANTIAIRGMAPQALDAIKQKHTEFRAVISENEQVLGTVREVSETLIRRTAERVSEASRPSTYSSGAKANPAASQPVAAVACDRSL